MIRLRRTCTSRLKWHKGTGEVTGYNATRSFFGVLSLGRGPIMLMLLVTVQDQDSWGGAWTASTPTFCFSSGGPGGMHRCTR